MSGLFQEVIGVDHRLGYDHDYASGYKAEEKSQTHESIALIQGFFFVSFSKGFSRDDAAGLREALYHNGCQHLCYGGNGICCHEILSKSSDYHGYGVIAQSQYAVTYEHRYAYAYVFIPEFPYFSEKVLDAYIYTCILQKEISAYRAEFKYPGYKRTQGSAGFDRFVELMRTNPEIQDAPDAKVLSDVKGEIRFDHVSFSYKSGIPVLNDINLTIAPGETFALVGSTGGGKTTICHLIPRFYDVTSGAVLVDGQDVRTLTQESLRQNIGIIQQDVFLFAGTIMENIRYGRPSATDREVIQAAICAEIHEDILHMPDGYQSFVGERGVVLSGGQKQRISIARVFLKNPPILILDEATSALDSVTEQRIQRSIDRLSEGKTVVVIAHRLSTIRNADRIAVVDAQHIVEQGSREELLARDGAYAALEHAQSQG